VRRRSKNLDQARKIRLADYVVKEVSKFGLKTNIYSIIVRGFLNSVVLDLDGKFQVYPDIRKELKRRTLEDLFTFYSREATIALHNLFKTQSNDIKELLKDASIWIKSIYEASCSLFDIVYLFNLETNTRLIINTKSPYMPLEIGIGWHPYFNLPYIPASALKGIVRYYFETHKIKVCGLDSSILFGETSREGILIFYDALPTSYKDALIEPDVITPHYPEVEGKIDELFVSPRPLVYPTVAPGVRFSTILAVNLSYINNIDLKSLINELKDHVATALSLGIGARVSLGYGFVKVCLMNIGGKKVRI